MVVRRPVPEPQASKLAAATEELERARADWFTAVIEAIDTGASLREIAALAGVSHGTIETLANRHRPR